ncbi:UNVERIFIED_CONTAM: Ubiquitin carboxyl-terminal hydrolase 20 [Sesamum radiatum]|uniref:Ubiquitin carboxyl-terminal hydrolase n=1 Tax=Sesamum radiatum TaxID=300843 RepID=A0AAW2L6X8_SESRA
MGSANSDCLSPWSDEKSPELYDAALLLEDESEGKRTETDDDDERINSSPRHSDWPVQISAGVDADTSPSIWLPQNNKPVTVGAGLANLGNTCFLNSVLQCFIHMVPLLRGLLSDTHLGNSSCNEEGFCILCALRQLVELSLASTNRVVSPWNLVNNLSYLSSNFQRFQQEDAHEFLQCFLDRLESCHDSKRKDCLSSQSDNFVKQVFGGRIVSKLKCCSCGHFSDTYEPSIDLSLEIGDADDLLTALQSFTKVEKIEDPETKFTCEKCKEQVSIEKQLSFDQAPYVATFHLKRFKNDGCLVQKIDKHVAFPLELDLAPFTVGGKKDDLFAIGLVVESVVGVLIVLFFTARVLQAELKYVLYAVVVHIGLTSTSGHYYCFIRLSPSMWCKFDDAKVVLVDEDFVLSQEAYILFYAKKGSAWFSSFIQTQKLCVDSTVWDTSPKSVLDNVDTSSVSPIFQNKFNGDSDGVNDTGSERKELENNEIKDSRPVHNESEKGSEYNLDRMSVSVAPADASDVSLPQAHKEVSTILLETVNQRQEVRAAEDSQNITQTPMRSPSPEIYREDPPEAAFLIPRHHLRLVDRVSCKRRLDKDMDDLETRQACTFIKKSIPGSRGQQLLSALRGSKTDASVNRKKSRRSELPLRKDDRSASTHHGSSIRSAQRPLVAGAYSFCGRYDGSTSRDRQVMPQHPVFVPLSSLQSQMLPPPACRGVTIFGCFEGSVSLSTSPSPSPTFPFNPVLPPISPLPNAKLESPILIQPPNPPASSHLD